MNVQRKFLTVVALATLAAPPLVWAQDGNVALAAYVPPGAAASNEAGSAAPATAAYTRQELEQMLAPVALYPDALLAQIMMAATYPLEVVEAARWSRANPGLKGDDAVRAVDGQEWDPSVKSLAAFPQVLAQLDDNLAWTERLGNAFLAQQAEVMQTVQNLRAKAESTGNLASNQQVRVEQQGGDIVVEPVDSQAVYVPYYDPAVVYGPIWQPAYPPMYFAPPYGYNPGYYPRTALYWGPAIFISAGFFFGAFDWHRHCVSVVSTRPFYVRPGFGGRPGFGVGLWQHDPLHRHGIAYRDPGSRAQFGRPGFAAARAPIASVNNMARPAGVNVPAHNTAATYAGTAQVPAVHATTGAAPWHGAEHQRYDNPGRGQFRQSSSFNDAAIARYAQSHSFAPAPYFAQSAHYSAPARVQTPVYSSGARGNGGAAYSYAAPRPTMLATVSSAHYSASAHGSGYSGSPGHGGGGHGHR